MGARSKMSNPIAYALSHGENNTDFAFNGKVELRGKKVLIENFDPKIFSAGDILYLSGEIFTLRDKACKLLIEKPLKNLRIHIIYTSGPIFKNGRILSIGPTTSSRMELFLDKLIGKYNVKAIIGKGGMNRNIIKRNKICYLLFTGGAGALASKFIEKVVATYFDELGEAERIYHLYVKNFGPLIVAIDSYGNSILRNFV